jgi:hypothetical protein
MHLCETVLYTVHCGKQYPCNAVVLLRIAGFLEFIEYQTVEKLNKTAILSVLNLRQNPLDSNVILHLQTLCMYRLGVLFAYCGIFAISICAVLTER